MDLETMKTDVEQTAGATTIALENLADLNEMITKLLEAKSVEALRESASRVREQADTIAGEYAVVVLSLRLLRERAEITRRRAKIDAELACFYEQLQERGPRA